MGIPYNLDIPASDHNPSNDQPLMEANNNAVNQILGVDHYSFNTTLAPTTNSGFHQWSTYVDQSSDPGSMVSTLRLYSKLVSGVSQLFFQRDANSTVIPFTGPQIAATPGYITLPGGIIMQWGVASIDSSTGIFTFPYTMMTQLFAVTLGPQQGATMWVSASSATSVTITRAGGGSSGCWVTVIGM